jgi:hypothetical protein
VISDFLWFLILLAAFLYAIGVNELVGHLKHRYQLQHPAWFFLRISGLPVLIIVMLVMLLQPWLTG